jgi:hypothetical protein
MQAVVIQGKVVIVGEFFIGIRRRNTLAFARATVILSIHLAKGE